MLIERPACSCKVCGFSTINVHSQVCGDCHNMNSMLGNPHNIARMADVIVHNPDVVRNITLALELGKRKAEDVIKRLQANGSEQLRQPESGLHPEATEGQEG